MLSGLSRACHSPWRRAHWHSPCSSSPFALRSVSPCSSCDAPWSSSAAENWVVQQDPNGVQPDSTSFSGLFTYYYHLCKHMNTFPSKLAAFGFQLRWLLLHTQKTKQIKITYIIITSYYLSYTFILYSTITTTAITTITMKAMMTYRKLTIMQQNKIPKLNSCCVTLSSTTIITSTLSLSCSRIGLCNKLNWTISYRLCSFFSLLAFCLT